MQIATGLQLETFLQAIDFLPDKLVCTSSLCIAIASECLCSAVQYYTLYQVVIDELLP